MSTRSFSLQPEHELRLEVSTSDVAVMLTTGTAEVFGAELAIGQLNTIPPGSKVAIFSWHGCVIEVSGEPDMVYQANETPMRMYHGIQAQLDGMRCTARETSGRGPRVLVAGPTDSGKSTLCKILVNYAVRTEHRPTYVDLDVGQGSVVLPGTIAATTVSMPLTVDRSYPISAPLVYNYGAASPGANTEHFIECLQQLATRLDEHSDADQDARASGLVINTCGWVEGTGYQLLVQSINMFNVDMVLVLGDERLWSLLSAEVPQKQVIKLSKSGGVVSRDANFRRRSRMTQIREYFYGKSGTLSPDSRLLNFSDCVLYRVTGGQAAPSSAMPIGAESLIHKLTVELVTPGPDLVNSVLAVSYAETSDQVLSSNVAGFICVQKVDVENKRMTILAPCPGFLPNSVLLVGDIKWVEI